MDRISPDIEMVDDAMAAILRQKTDAERLAIGFGMWEFARRLIEANVRADHPEWPNDEVRRQVARRMSHGAV
jgi:Rv0078B-related antitoxin